MRENIYEGALSTDARHRLNPQFLIPNPYQKMLNQPITR